MTKMHPTAVATTNATVKIGSICGVSQGRTFPFAGNANQKPKTVAPKSRNPSIKLSIESTAREDK
jgi:hypothetical protein